MKKTLALVLVLLLALSLGACSKAAPAASSTEVAATSSSTEEVKTWKVGYACRDTSDLFFNTICKTLEELDAADDSIELTIANAGDDSQTQLDQLDNFNVQGMDAIVLSPRDGSTVVDYVNEWNEKGLPVFCISQKSDSGVFTYVGCSDYDTGLLEGEWCYNNLPQGAKILYLGGDLGYQTSIDRRQGLCDGLKERIKADWEGNVLNENGDVEILSWQLTMYTMEEGQTITEDWIQTFGKDGFNCIVGVNDSTVLGAREALKSAGIEGVALVGIDALDDSLAAIKEGTMSATVMQSAKDQAVALWDAIKVAKDGGTNPENIFPDLVVIDKNNVNDYIG